MNSIVENVNASPDKEVLMPKTEHYILDWVIPFYHAYISDWDSKKKSLLKVWETCALPNMHGAEQLSDYGGNEDKVGGGYHAAIQAILWTDIQQAVNELGFTTPPILNSAWFQTYQLGMHHPMHNHGVAPQLSMVVYLNFDSSKHHPTSFMAPYNSLSDGNVLEYCPKDVREGSMIVFPSALNHYAPTNQNDEERMILAGNIEFGV